MVVKAKNRRWYEVDKDNIPLGKLAQHFEAYNRSEGKSLRTVECYCSVLDNPSIRRILSKKLEYIYTSRLRHDVSAITPENKAILSSICSELAERKRRERNEKARSLVSNQLELWRDFQRMDRTYEEMEPKKRMAILPKPTKKKRS